AFVATTFAPAITSPLGSRTTPVKVAVGVWLKAIPLNTQQITAASRAFMATPRSAIYCIVTTRKNGHHSAADYAILSNVILGQQLCLNGISTLRGDTLNLHRLRSCLFL